MASAEIEGDVAGLVALLRWYEAMGVDAVVEDRAHDRFVDAVAAPPAPLVTPSPPLTGASPSRRPGMASAPPPRSADPTLFADAAVAAARDAAAGATTLDELRAMLDAFEGCGLRRTASRLVFADGNPASRIMVVGEAPGAEEDRSGVPFVGRGGQLLDRMLAAIGLDRTQVYIANIVPWRPPGNREPTPQEVAICLPFVRRQIALCDPEVVLLMGNAALKALAPGRAGITKARGRWIEVETGVRAIRALPMLHPAYLLRQPGQKKLAWRDWRVLQRALRKDA